MSDKYWKLDGFDIARGPLRGVDGWDVYSEAEGGNQIFLSDEQMDMLVQFMQAPAAENDERYGVEVPV